MNTKPETVIFASPAAPANGATIVLWSSCSPSAGVNGAFGPKMMRMLDMTMLEIKFIQHATNASAANGLKPYVSQDGGTTWLQTDFAGTMPVQVAALAANATKEYKFVVTDINDFKVEYTAGATAPTTWALNITGIFGAAAVQK